MKAIFLVLLLFLSVIPLRSEPVEDAWNAYLIGDFDKVEKIVSSSLKLPDLSDSTRAMLYFTVGCSDAMQGRDISAISAFERALDIDPGLRKKSSDLPPPVWEIFSPIQEKAASVRTSIIVEAGPVFSENTINNPDTLKVYVPVMRDRSTILKSFSFPGWGHLSEGRKKGLVFGSIEALSVMCFVWSIAKTADERDDYLRENDVNQIQSEYDEYNLYYKLSWGFGLSTAITYIAAQIDFFSTLPPASLSIENSPSGHNLLQLSIKL